MSESFERLADKVAEKRAEQRAEQIAKQTTVNCIRLMMKNVPCSLDEALNALEITGKDRAIIAKQVALELRDDGRFIKKKQSTSQMFEEFYGKPFDEITQNDLSPAKEINWGEDVGSEVINPTLEK